MDIQSVKIHLIHWLTEINDEKILEQLTFLKESYEKDWWDDLSKEEQTLIDEGINQLDQGEGTPHQEVMKKIRKKFDL